jgi:flagellar biosynthesis/type III secretory pathway protein FliH
MQVLQRIDLFTDTGLKEQLARHLQPIVARASAELVGEINDQVGKLVRSYVAEAIEREIAQWRSEHR